MQMRGAEPGLEGLASYCGPSRPHERTGRALDDKDFVLRLEEALARALRRQRSGAESKTEIEEHADAER